jgi:hypothetical protein
MEISRKAPTAKGPADTFTGDVWIDPITRGLPPSQLNVAAVHFTPGARSAWHSHDGGQTLYVTEGHGLVQSCRRCPRTAAARPHHAHPGARCQRQRGGLMCRWPR